ncbi:hypothetical protein GW915_13505 [bacterium]|nr:hypothetical protein [bacterium]
MDSFDRANPKSTSPAHSSPKGETFKNLGSLVPKGMTASRYEVRQLDRGNIPSYSQIKNTFEADVKGPASSFHLSEYVRSQLSVEEKEARRFEEKVQALVVQQVEKLAEETKKLAFDEGFKEGLEKAYNERKEELDNQLTLSNQMIEDLNFAKSNLGLRYQVELSELAIRLAEILVHYEIKTAPELISHTILEMIERISKDDDVIIRLSKDYAELIEKVKAQIEGDAGNAERRIQFELSDRIKKGDATIECMSGEVASFLDEKVQLLRARLIDSLEEVVV